MIEIMKKYPGLTIALFALIVGFILSKIFALKKILPTSSEFREDISSSWFDFTEDSEDDNYLAPDPAIQKALDAQRERRGY